MKKNQAKEPSSRSFRDRYGPWALVTGASSGIGREMALLLGAAGVNLVLVGRRDDALKRVAERLSGEGAVSTRVVAADLSTPAGLEAARSATADLSVGLLVLAAGFGSSGPFLAGDAEREEAMLRVNCGAPMLLARHHAQAMADRGHGGIILFGSIVGFQGTPFAAHYGATKAYIQSLGEALHRELVPRGVDVLVSAPGPVHTGFADAAGMTMGTALEPAQVARATLNSLGRRTTVYPGALTKLLSGSLALLPRGLRSRIMGGVMRGMARDSGRVEASHV